MDSLCRTLISTPEFQRLKDKVVAQTPEMAQTPERPLSSFSPIFMWIGISVRNMFIQSNVLESSRIFQNE